MLEKEKEVLLEMIEDVDAEVKERILSKIDTFDSGRIISQILAINNEKGVHLLREKGIIIEQMKLI